MSDSYDKDTSEMDNIGTYIPPSLFKGGEPKKLPHDALSAMNAEVLAKLQKSGGIDTGDAPPGRPE